MKFLIKCLIVKSILVGSAMAADFHILPSIDRSSNQFGVKVVNKTNDELFCKEVELDVFLKDKQFGDPKGGFRDRFSNIYILDNATSLKSISLSDLGYDDNNTTIDNIVIRGGDCQPATFADFCEFHPNMTEADYETVMAIMNSARTNDCSQVQDRLGTSLGLRKSGISSFKPISFLRKLKYVYVQENDINELQGIDRLQDLKVLKINGNPVRDINKAIRLPEIRWVDASRTDVYEIDLRGVERHMKHATKSRGTHVFNTPYSRQELPPVQ